jgi:glutathione S-transferase
MTITLYHHPFTRAAGVVWMLEEVGAPYTLRFVDLKAAEHKQPELLRLNPMGKLPILVDGDQAITEGAAIGLYLADRYKPGDLAPELDAPTRGAYLRWILFAPSVVEPGAMAKAGGWEYREGSAGWGSHEAMLTTIDVAIGKGPFLLGERFSMADVVFGGTLRYMMQFKMLEATPTRTDYVARLDARPAYQRAQAKNNAVAEERGLSTG